MTYDLSVRIAIRPQPASGGVGSGLELAETVQVELSTLSDAAGILVKLHELFEALQAKNVHAARGRV